MRGRKSRSNLGISSTSSGISMCTGRGRVQPEQGKGPRQHFRHVRRVLQRMAEGADTGDQRTLVRQFMQVTVPEAQVLATVQVEITSIGTESALRPGPWR